MHWWEINLDMVKERPRLCEYYNSVIAPQWVEKKRVSSMMVPRLEKISLNIGVGTSSSSGKAVKDALYILESITGQRPVQTYARKSVAGFRLREGMAIGAKVTLRRFRMYEFLDRLITIAMPRIRDFRGVSRKCFDGFGNFSMGIVESHIFPEIDYDKVERMLGMNVNIGTTANSNKEAAELLENFGIPFL